MDDGEIANEENRKDVDITSKIEKCVMDENAPESSDKEDGELDDEGDADTVQTSDDVIATKEPVENTESGDVKETDSPVKTEAPKAEESVTDVVGDKESLNDIEKQTSLEKDTPHDKQDRKPVVEENSLDDEEGELSDEGVPDKTNDLELEQKSEKSPGNNKETSSVRMEFDESRPEEEQLDYGEDELEEKIKESGEIASDKKASDGEVDSDSEGELKSDAGDDFEEGETRDHPLDVPPEKKKICRFYEMGNCTWGDHCRYLHPGVNDKGNYNMFCDEPPKRPEPVPPQRNFPPHPHLPPDPFWEEPPPFIPPPAAETAWEKGLRHAKEMKKRALQRKVQEPDFLQKREVISTICALNEDRDMEFVNIAPLANKGYDPFKEEETGEYATPTAEEVRRHLNRDRRHPPPTQRHPADKDRHRLPPPDHMMHVDSRRDRRPPSPRRERYPHEGRGLSPRRDIERERPGHFPPNELGFAPQFNDRRERQDFPGGINQGMHHAPPDVIRRETGIERVKDDRYMPGGPSKGVQNGGPPSGQGQTWSDPWARGRPQTKGRNKAKSDSSSSSDSSSGSSSRSSSSGSSRSSYSSKSSSSGSDSSSYSSARDSSRSPSPGKGGKKKVLATAKQRNAAPGVMKKTVPPPTVKPVVQSGAAAIATHKPAVPLINKNPPINKMVQIPAVPIVPPTKTVPKKKVRKQSSSSSEFSHSSDSSPSPSRAKNKSGSDSDSGSSSGSSSSSASSSSSSSSSDSEGDKPANRRKRKPMKPPTSQIQHSILQHQVPATQQPVNKGKVMVPSKPGRKDIKMTIIDKPGMAKKRTAAEMTGQGKKSASRRNELLEQLRVVEDAIARKRAKMN